MHVRLALVAVFASAFVACTPGRDNVYDPQSAPIVSFSVVDTGPSVLGVCAPNPVEPPLGFARVSESSRGRCLALDASGSKDHDGNSVGLRYTFTVPGVDLPIDSASPRVVIPDAARLALPLLSIIDFGAVVTDTHGHPAFATTSVVLHNSAPVAVAEAPRTFPVGGFPWSPGADFQVVLDGSASSDPDGDPIRWCWTLPPAAEICGDSPRVTYTLPSAVATRVIATLRVADGPAAASAGDPHSLFSNPVSETIAVGVQGDWAYSASLSAALRLEPRPPVFAALSRIVPVATPVADVNGTAWIAYLDDPASSAMPAVLRFASPVSGTDAASVTSLGIDAHALHQAEDGTLWVVSTDLNGDVRLDAFDVSAGAQISRSAQLPQSLVTPSYGNVSGTGDIATDGLGRVWWEVGSSDVFELDQGAPSVSSFSGETVALARRPLSSEVWIAKTPNPTFGAAVDAGLFRLAGATSASQISLGARAIYGFAWINPDEFWISVRDDGIRRVDINLLEASGNLEAATILRAPSLPGAYGSVVDPATGALWVRDIEGSISRVDLDGSITSIAGTQSTALFVDPTGDVWTRGDAGGLRSAETPDPTGTVARRVISLSPSTVGPDVATNGLWIARSGPAGFLHLAQDASISRQLPRDEGPALSSLELAFSPGGTFAWALRSPLFSSANSVLRYDLTGTTAVETMVLDSNQIPSGNNAFRGFVFAASAPLPASTPFLWIDKNNSVGPDTLVQVDGAGTITPRFSIPGADARLHGVNSPRTNRLCAVTDDGVNAYVRWLSPAGGVQTFTVPFPTATSEVHGMGVSPGTAPGSDVCWVIWQDLALGQGACNATNPADDGFAYYLRGFTTSATPFRSIDVPVGGHLDSFRPVSADAFWTVTFDYFCPAAERRNHYDRVSGTMWNAKSFETTHPPPFLIDPNSAVYPN